MNNYDHYAEAALLTQMLARDGLKSYGDRIADVIDAGSTGTEIFMALRSVLAEVVNQPSCSEKTRRKAQRLMSELNAALNQ